ncbi:hypothetical protein AVJ23_01895 [Pseudoponticoccus marisrubri]|uniref:DUF4174 domain-containing protein n=2 Tax=Pseudoponticoccus marisrubri TaxID=1685382 RepID=A0A0W7WQG4_9RHOB|nr:hypothetical protein AVJ23_01895 [Pseudoponticoccus marisrubri]
MAADELFRPLAPERAELGDLQWQARPVLVFADGPEDQRFRQQMTALRASSDGLAARDIVVLTDTDPSAKGRLRAALAVEGFTVLLVGKDGGVKLRSDEPIATDDLFSTIDAMPMRQREMRDD